MKNMKLAIENRHQAAAALALSCLLLGAAGCEVSEIPEPVANVEAALALRAGGGDGSGGGEGPAQPTGTGWGSLKGVFKLTGGAPATPPLSTGGKDLQVCGAQAPNETVVVGSGGGLANVVIYARKVSRVHESVQQPPAEPAVFDQKKCVFLSHVLGVRVGQPVEILNSDPIGHNTNISPMGNPSSNTLLGGGDQSTYTFARPIVAPTEVTCNIHPWMKAYIMARDDPYFAITADDGSFEIANLPAGEQIEFQVWHERSPNGLEAKGDWARGRFTVTVPQDGVQDLGAIEVPASALQ